MPVSATKVLHAATVAEVAKRRIAPVLFMFADFPGGAVRIWTGQGPLAWDGETWLGLGHFISLGEATESTDTDADQISVTVSGFRSEFFDPVMLGNFVNREATIWLGFVTTSTGQVINDPYKLFSGVMSHDEIVDDGKTSSITITAVNRLADLLRPREIRYTHEDQQLLHPGENDMGLEFVAELQDLAVKWGKPSNAG